MTSSSGLNSESSLSTAARLWRSWPRYAAISQGGLLSVMDHPNRTKYAHQKMLAVRIQDYVYLVPCVESDAEIFLKSIIPSRKATKRFLPGEK